MSEPQADHAKVVAKTRLEEAKAAERAARASVGRRRHRAGGRRPAERPWMWRRRNENPVKDARRT